MRETLHVLIVTLACLTTVVALVYGLRSPWYRFKVGQRLFADRVVMAGLLWLQVIGTMGIRIPLWVWAACIMIFILIEAWNFVLILQAQKQHREMNNDR
jgi:hypothetical protein